MQNFYFGVEGRQLFGCLHSPLPAKDKGIGFVICYPFGHERIRAHRVLYNYAQSLSENGYWVLRFDYWGCGDSEGSWEDVTALTMGHDVVEAVDFLKGQMPSSAQVGLVGLRFGATLAAEVAEEDARIRYLALFSPTLKPKDYVFERLRAYISTISVATGKVAESRNQIIAALKTGKPANIDGFHLSTPLYLSMEPLDLLAHKKKFTGDISVTEIIPPGKEFVSKNMSESLLLSYGRASTTRLGAVQAPNFWDLLRSYSPRIDALASETLQWLPSILRGRGE